MKRILFLMILSCFTVVGFAQTTYYWVGGNNVTATSLTGAHWSTSPAGTPATRTNVSTDILVFNGVNVKFSMGSGSIGKLKLENGADVSFVRSSNSGTSTLTLNGNLGQGLELTDDSKLRIADDLGGVFVVSFASTITGAVQSNSKVYVEGTVAHRIVVPTAGALVFDSGAECYVNSTQYPFSGLSTSNPSAIKSVVFNAASSLVYRGGRSPFGDSNTDFVIDLKEGSNLVFETNNNVPAIIANKWLRNVVFRASVTVAMPDDNFNNIDNLTIESGSTFLLRGTGPSPISGNIVNNGTLGITTSGTSNLIMIGRQPQSISGNGSFDLGAISVAEDAHVTLNSSIKLTGTLISYIYGILNLQNNQIVISGSGSNVGRVQFRSSLSTSTTGATITSGSNIISFTDVSNYNALSVAPGMLITGTGIEANTYVINTASAGTITLSKPATISDGNGSVSVFASAPTLVTSNVNGIDGGFSFDVGGSLSLSTGTNIIFNAATLSPFSANNSNALGDVTFNASATTNRDLTINGKLTLNNAKLTVREGDVLTVAPTATFDGIFGNNAYISTASNNSSTVVGKLRLTNLATFKLIPVGTATHYTPVTLAPTATSTFEINVFEGATANAAPNGTALTAVQKARMVDAVWNIVRSSGSGDVGVTLDWDAGLEGTDFANFTSAQIGIAGYEGSAYGAFAGSGDADLNTATLTTSTLSQFIVGEANTTLPLKLLSFTTKESLNSVKLAWQTTSEVNLKNYVLQHKTATGFQDIYTVAANNQAGIFNYGYTHLNPSAGVNYYRLVGVDFDGTTQTSDPISVIFTSANAVAVYPNPVSNNTVTVSGVVSGDVIRILNIQGQVIVTQKASGDQVQEINLQNVQSGTYILSIENAGKVTNTRKVIKI